MKKSWAEKMNPTVRVPKNSFPYFLCKTHNQMVNYPMCLARTIIMKPAFEVYSHECRKCERYCEAKNK